VNRNNFLYLKMNKKASGMSIELVAISILVLLALAVMAWIFVSQSSGTSKTLTSISNSTGINVCVKYPLPKIPKCQECLEKKVEEQKKCLEDLGNYHISQ